MKSTKTKSTAPARGPLICELDRTLPASQALALDDLMLRFQELRLDPMPERDDVARMVLSVGLFVLGLDPAGDSCLEELTDALHGTDSPNAKKVEQIIADAGHEAEIAEVNRQRANRTSWRDRTSWRARLKGHAA